MPYAWPLLLLAIGLFFLYKGAAILIDNAAGMARDARVPLTVIGFTIVSFGTTLPELTVSVLGGVAGQSDLVLGNALGSFMANIGLVLGVAAIISPVGLATPNERKTLYGLIASGAAVYVLLRDGLLSRFDGALLVLLGLAFSGAVIYYNRETTKVKQVLERAVTLTRRREKLLHLLAVIAGAALLFVGARMVVTNATAIARLFGLSDLLIGLTLVAVGTSLPELVTAILSSKRKTAAVTVGNVIGASMLNLTTVLGTAVLISPLTIGRRLYRFDLPVIIAAALLIMTLMRSGRKLTRLEGVLLVAGYVAYVAVSFLVANGR